MCQIDVYQPCRKYNYILVSYFYFTLSDILVCLLCRGLKGKRLFNFQYSKRRSGEDGCPTCQPRIEEQSHGRGDDSTLSLDGLATAKGLSRTKRPATLLKAEGVRVQCKNTINATFEKPLYYIPAGSAD